MQNGNNEEIRKCFIKTEMETNEKLFFFLAVKAHKSYTYIHVHMQHTHIFTKYPLCLSRSVYVLSVTVTKYLASNCQ